MASGDFKLKNAVIALCGILLIAAATVALLAANWNLAQGENGPVHRLGRCVVAARPLSPGTLVRESDLLQKLCSRPVTGASLKRSDVLGKYVKARIEEGRRLDPADLQDGPAAPPKILRVLVKVPDGRAACLKKHDRVLLVETAGEESKERAIIPDPPLNEAKEGFEILECPFKVDDQTWLVAVAVPAELRVEAARIALGEWSPILLNDRKPLRCRNPPATS